MSRLYYIFRCPGYPGVQRAKLNWIKMFWHETKVLLVTIRCSEWHSNMYVLGAAGDSWPVLHYLAPKRVMAEKALWWVHTDGAVWNLYLWYSLVSSHQGKEKCGVFKCSCFSNEHSWVQGEFLNYCYFMHVKYELGGRRGPAMFAEVSHRSAVWPLASVTAMCEALIRSRFMGDYHFSFRNSHISV